MAKRIKDKYEDVINRAIEECIDNLRSWKAFASIEKTLKNLEDGAFRSLIKRMIEIEMFSHDLSRGDIRFENGKTFEKEKAVFEKKSKNQDNVVECFFSDIHQKENAEAIKLSIRGMVRRKKMEGNDSIKNISVIDYQSLTEIFKEILNDEKNELPQYGVVSPMVSYLEDVWCLVKIYKSSFLLSYSYEEQEIVGNLFDGMLNNIHGDVKKRLVLSMYENANISPKEGVACLKDIIFNKRMQSDNNEWVNDFIELLIEVYHQDKDSSRKERFIQRVMTDYSSRFVSIETERLRNKEFVSEMLARMIDIKELDSSLIKVNKSENQREIELEIKSLIHILDLYKIGVFDKSKDLVNCTYLSELDEDKVVELFSLINQESSKNNENIKEMLCIYTIADRLGRVTHELCPDVKVSVKETIRETNGLKKFKVLLETETGQEIDDILGRFLKIVVGYSGFTATDFTDKIMPYVDDYLVLKEVNAANALKELNMRNSRSLKRKF